MVTELEIVVNQLLLELGLTDFSGTFRVILLQENNMIAELLRLSVETRHPYVKSVTL